VLISSSATNTLGSLTITAVGVSGDLTATMREVFQVPLESRTYRVRRAL
jgi:hypothetical protein